MTSREKEQDKECDLQSEARTGGGVFDADVDCHGNHSSVCGSDVTRTVMKICFHFTFDVIKSDDVGKNGSVSTKGNCVTIFCKQSTNTFLFVRYDQANS